MENFQPNLLSIIVPAFNAEKYINRCINSVLRQTYRNIELIVVNDCSTDNTKEILEKLSYEDGRVKVIHLDFNVGIHAARVTGLNIANGEYIGFIDSDDWIDVNAYKHMLSQAQDNQADIVICGTDKLNENGKFLGTHIKFINREIHTENILNLFCTLYFGSGVLWNKIYHSKIIKKYGMLKLERKVDASEDYIVNIGCFDEARKIILLPNSYYHYLIRDNSASRSEDNAKNFCRVLTAYIECLKKYDYFDNKKLLSIDELYATQLRYSDYLVHNLKWFNQYNNLLKSCLIELSIVRPQSIYQLIHSFDVRKKAKKQRIKNFIKFFYKKIRNFTMRKKVYY